MVIYKCILLIINGFQAFFQTDFWAGGDYRKATPNYKIYRWE
ncbi:hypothetical protein [Psychroserpens sp. NJDZ02]|nr:hypothetical protein [Psychroserpens sp. NJDZ02]